MQELRRCREDRWDFTAEDSNIFPIRIEEGGGLYGFCPSKATWDREAISFFELMVVAVETKNLLLEGGIADQPSWFISSLHWFAPEYDLRKFQSRVKMVLGDEAPEAAAKAKVPKPRGKR